MPVDLFLGGPLGLWALDQVDRSQVRLVCTYDETIRYRARDLGMQAYTGHHIIDIDPHPDSINGLSVHYPDLFEPEFLTYYRVIYNIHPALLPWGRCYYPVFWALWTDEPAGCTLHVITPGIDDGPIVAQRAVAKYDWDTGGTLHARVSEAEKGLFIEYWPRIAASETLPATAQPAGGSFHSRRDFFALKSCAHLDQLAAHELLKLIRYLSHPAYSGLIVEFGGRQYEISARPLP